MKVGLAQLNPTIGAFKKNEEKLLQSIAHAKRAGISLLVFSELTTTGYPPRDLLLYSDFIDENLSLLETLKTASAGITLVVGFAERNQTGSGRPLFNSAAVLQNGKQIAHYRKHFLPYYDVFDECRYFEPAEEKSNTVFEVEGKRIGITICEDLWNLPGFVAHAYGEDLFEILKGQDLDLVVNLSASPFHVGKPALRTKLFGEIAQKLSAPLIFANQVGGNDSLLFDGGSLIFDAAGKLKARGPAFEEALLDWELGAGPSKIADWPATPNDWISQSLVLGLRDFVRKCGFRKVCLGLSGGIDSAVVAVLAVRAFGAENVVGLLLPSKYTASMSNDDASTLAKNLGIQTHTIAIENVFEAFQRALRETIGAASGITLENIQPRIRMTLLMAFANAHGSLLLNTSNKSEIATGFSTLYGDSAGAISVIGDLTKEQVYDLAKYLNRTNELIPDRILTRAPSAELRENQVDQDVLPPYPMLDRWVTEAVEFLKSPSDLSPIGTPDQQKGFARFYAHSEYKRQQFPPILRISAHAFGLGHRMPIAGQSIY